MLLLLAACSRPQSGEPSPPPSPPAPPPTVGERFGDWPFLAAIDAPPTVALVDGGEIPANPAACGACHPDHYAEWRGATHAAALSDLQYVAELAKPGQPRWLCLNCHLPTRPQRAQRVDFDVRFAAPGDLSALEPVPEPSFDPTRVAEGVGCPTCHVRRDEDGAGVVVGPRGSGRAPHRVRHDPAALTTVCERCHSPGPARLTPTFTCWFESREELEAGPLAGASCPSCHMPETERAPAVGAPVATVRRHLWLGGGVPKDYAGYERLRADGFESGLDVAVSTAPALEVALTNARSGHLLPTGDPERHLRVEVRAEDAAGSVLARQVLRIGQRWDWGDEATGRPAVRLADDRLKPGETRRWAPSVATAGADRLVVEVDHVKVSPDNVKYMAAAVIDPELAALRPDAAALLPEFDRHYPLATVLWREEIPLDGRPRRVWTAEERLAASAALATTPLAEKAARLGIPAAE